MRCIAAAVNPWKAVIEHVGAVSGSLERLIVVLSHGSCHWIGRWFLPSVDAIVTIVLSLILPLNPHLVLWRSKQRCDLSESIGYLQFFSYNRWFETWLVTFFSVDINIL